MCPEAGRRTATCSSHAGHYEGFDERISQSLQPLELSIGDYVLSGGELAAMVSCIDAVASAFCPAAPLGR